MPNAVDPSPNEKILTAGEMSPMRFQKEYLIHDSEIDSLVRFRGPFIMPNWSGVEENESDYVVENSWTRLDQVAAERYGKGKEELMWVIAARNGLDLPDAQLYKGKKLKVPNLDWVEDVLLKQAFTLVGQE